MGIGLLPPSAFLSSPSLPFGLLVDFGSFGSGFLPSPSGFFGSLSPGFGSSPSFGDLPFGSFEPSAFLGSLPFFVSVSFSLAFGLSLGCGLFGSLGDFGSALSLLSVLGCCQRFVCGGLLPSFDFGSS